MSEKTDEILELLKGISLLEASELVTQIEETFGVDASASAGGGMMMPMAVAGAPAVGGDAPVEEEQTEFNVVLDDVGGSKIPVLKVVRALTGLGLKEAKDMVEKAGAVIKEGVSKDEAEDVKKQLEEAGAKVSIK